MYLPHLDHPSINDVRNSSLQQILEQHAAGNHSKPNLQLAVLPDAIEKHRLRSKPANYASKITSNNINISSLSINDNDATNDQD